MNDGKIIIDLDVNRIPIASIDLQVQILSEQRAILQAVSALIAKANGRSEEEVFRSYMEIASGHVRGILSDLYGKYGATPDITPIQH